MRHKAVELSWHVRSCARNPVENYIEVDVCRAGRIDISFSGKRRLDFTRTALLQKEDHWNDKKKSNFSMNFEFLVLTWKNKEIFFYCGIFFVAFPRASGTSLSSYLIWNRVFEIFNTWWSYDKFLIDSVWSGQTGNYLALGQNVWTKRIGPTRSSRI